MKQSQKQEVYIFFSEKSRFCFLFGFYVFKDDADFTLPFHVTV